MWWGKKGGMSRKKLRMDGYKERCMKEVKSGWKENECSEKEKMGREEETNAIKNEVRKK